MTREFKTFEVNLPGRESASLSFSLSSSGEISDVKLKAIGGPEFLKLIAEWRPKFVGNLKSIPLPVGSALAPMLLRELILRAQGQWNFPFNELELCHCRVIATTIVDAAIVCGAHTPREVSELTSASTACGTCRPDVEAIIKYRLNAS